MGFEEGSLTSEPPAAVIETAARSASMKVLTSLAREVFPLRVPGRVPQEVKG